MEIIRSQPTCSPRCPVPRPLLRSGTPAKPKLIDLTLALSSALSIASGHSEKCQTLISDEPNCPAQAHTHKTGGALLESRDLAGLCQEMAGGHVRPTVLSVGPCTLLLPSSERQLPTFHLLKPGSLTPSSPPQHGRLSHSSRQS